MRSRGDGQALALPIVLVVTTAIAFLPVRSRLDWQSDLARIISLPLQPLTFGGLKAADFLSPSAPVGPLDPADIERTEVLLDELRDRDRLVAALRGENARLRERLAQFTGMAGLGSDSGRRALYREVVPVSQRPTQDGTMTLLLRERRPGEVLPSPAMVVDPRRLIVLGEIPPGAMDGRQLLVRPITAPAVGPVRATVHPPTGTAAERRATMERLAVRAAAARAGAGDAGGRPRAGAGAADDGFEGVEGIDGLDLPASAVVIANVLLQPDGDGGWTADLAEEDAVQVGDRIRVDEATWPEATRGYELGRVTAVTPKEQSPFGSRMTVVPEVRLSDRPSMMFLADMPKSWEQDEGGEGGESGAGGGGTSEGLGGEGTP